MQSRGPRRAVVFGEALIDVYPDGEVVAGAALHVAAHLATTGWQVDFITRVGADRAGGRIVATLRSIGVDSAFVEMDHDLPTGHVDVLPRGGFTIHYPAAYDEIDGPKYLHDHTLFYYGSLAARSEISRTTLRRLLGVTRGLRALDLNLRSPHYTRSTTSLLVARAQLIKATARELTEAAGLLGIPAAPAGFFRANKALEWLCVTNGAAESEMFSRAGGRWRAPAPQVDVVDTVGAGDAFLARLAGALAAGFSEEAALQAGTIAAGQVLGHYGGLPRRGTRNT
jgi:fructokinase